MSLRGKKILITCGPTWVAIDDVRILSNRSTGEMGHLLANAISAAKASVTLLEGPVTSSAKLGPVRVLKYSYFHELKDALISELKRGYDCVIHAAAVSDFAPERKVAGKIRSNSKLTLRLAPLPKLINKIKELRPKIFLIGFKLESPHQEGESVEGTRKLFRQAKCDLVVANFAGANSYEALVLGSDRTLLGKVKSKKDLADLLLKILKERL